MIVSGGSYHIGNKFFPKFIKHNIRNFTTNRDLTYNNCGLKAGFLCLGVLTYPFWSNVLQEAYWSFKYNDLNKREILSDRFQWLHECMIKDEIERFINNEGKS